MFYFKRSKKNKNIFDVPAVLADFYALAHKLGNLRDVKFKELSDNGDELHWRFNYRGKKYILQFSIYHGLSLMAESRNTKEADDNLLKNEATLVA